MVKRRSGFFCKAFMMNSLAPTDISLGKENSHLIKKKGTFRMLFMVYLRLM
jgi:hypothetical protein